jgi:hypothetical protein
MNATIRARGAPRRGCWHVRVRASLARWIPICAAALSLSLGGSCRTAAVQSDFAAENVSAAPVPAPAPAPAPSRPATGPGFLRIDEHFPSEMHVGARHYAIFADGLCKRVDSDPGERRGTVQHGRIPAELVPTLLAHADSIEFETIPSDFDRGDLGFGRITLAVDHKAVEFDFPRGWRDDHAPDCETAARRARLYAFYWRIRTTVDLAIELNPQGAPLEFERDR